MPAAGPLRGGRATGASALRTGARDSGWTTLWVGAGRRAGMRPGDLVGAITNEAGVPPTSIGAIRIQDGFALVDVDAAQAPDIVRALTGATIRGRKLPVRIERAP